MKGTFFLRIPWSGIEFFGQGYFVDKGKKISICTLLLLSLPLRNQGLDNRSDVNGSWLSKVLIGGGGP
jgi:hypothetical protein